ncbi:MAG: formate dehydrogenase accessory protein FdhE, partial [Burkholderiaceae bacterium]
GSTDRVRKSPRILLPVRRGIFSERAARFESIAVGHSMGEYLRLMSVLADAQQSALNERSADPIPEAAIAASRDYGMPPLSAQSHERSAAWREDLRHIATAIKARSENGVASTVTSLEALSDTTLEALADRLLAGTSLDDDAAYVPFIGASLQVYFTRLAATLDEALVDHCDVPQICPVCASRPVASVLRVGGEQANLRYLVCSLCATEWNVSRIVCTSCDSDKGVKYYALQSQGAEHSDAAARAETCDECKSYLKIFYQEKDPNLDPSADDLATLALDLLVDEEGYARSGPNLLFHPGTS